MNFRSFVDEETGQFKTLCNLTPFWSPRIIQAIQINKLIRVDRFDCHYSQNCCFSQATFDAFALESASHWAMQSEALFNVFHWMNWFGGRLKEKNQIQDLRQIDSQCDWRWVTAVKVVFHRLSNGDCFECLHSEKVNENLKNSTY